MKLEIVKNRVVATAETDAESLLLMRFSEKPTTLAEKWDGHLPTTMVPGSSVPFINVNK